MPPVGTGAVSPETAARGAAARTNDGRRLGGSPADAEAIDGQGANLPKLVKPTRRECMSRSFGSIATMP